MRLACSNCREVFDDRKEDCPNCGEMHQVATLKERILPKESEEVAKEIDACGLGELVGPSDSIFIKVAPGRMVDVRVVQSKTAFVPSACHQSADFLWCVMSSKRLSKERRT
ncbi:MAG: hypothetical protein ACE5QW_01235 [Thermoplasmata archaeon]